MTKGIKPTIVVHDGRFHADDVFATATIVALLKRRGLYDLEDAFIVRTRDQKMIENAEFVMDVGGVYDPSLKRFDHHQQGGAGKRNNGIPYASFGLVWKTYGMELAGSQEVVDIVDARVVQPVDADDNGCAISKPIIDGVKHYGVYDVVGALNPTWKESEEERNPAFMKLVAVAEVILEREIARARDLVEANEKVRKIYEEAEDKRVLVFDRAYPSKVLHEYKEVLYVIKPNIVPTGGTWKIEVMSLNDTDYVLRKPLPSTWAGKRDKELQDITGVEDAVFCHNARFVATAGSKEGALKLVQLALENKE